jgi:flagellar protein FlgJ
MIDPITSRPVMAAGRTPAQDRTSQERSLRESARQLEGVFVQQLYKAMRETVPQGDGIVSGGAGEDMFTGLMDQHLAAETPSHWGGALSEALYRQLRGRLPAAESPLDSDSTTR